MEVVKRFSFDAAHFLPGYEGKCVNMHGHHWVVDIGVRGPVDKDSGMILDFTLLKKLADPVIDEMDHSIVNNIIKNPTAENICIYILDRLIERIANHDVSMGDSSKTPYLSFIRVWETEDSYAELRL